MSRYCCLNLSIYPLGDSKVFAYSTFGRKDVYLPRTLANMLLKCQEFKTLDEHAATVYRDIANQEKRQVLVFDNPIKIAEIRNQLSKLVELGLLISEDQLLDECYNISHTKDAATIISSFISSFAVITRNRPASLSRTLNSFNENIQANGRYPKYIVLDDSEGHAVQKQNVEVLRNLQQQCVSTLLYAGASEKRAYANKLITECGVPPDILEFALFDPENCGYTTGANRNAFMLQTVGEAAFYADDDTVCQLGKTFAIDDRTVVESAIDKCIKFRSYSSYSEIHNQINWENCNILALNESLLGLPIDQHLTNARTSSVIHFGQFSPTLLGGLRNGGRIVITIPGIAGDSGLHSPTHNLFLEGEERERVIENESKYRSAKVGRHLIRAVDSLTITDSPWFVATTMGIDNRFLLPPFMPVCRNSDGLFGLTLRTCFKNYFFAHLPYLILHEPEEHRSFELEDIWRKASDFRFTDIASACIGSFSANSIIPVTERDSMINLGKHLMGLGSLPQSDFDDFIYYQTLRQKSHYIVRLENILTKYKGKPDYWASDVRRCIGFLRESLLNKNHWVPKDLMINGRGSDEARQLGRRLIYRYGQLLMWWPEIVKAARNLKQRNYELAMPVRAPEQVTIPISVSEVKAYGKATRICFITSEYPPHVGGAARSAKRVVDGLVGRGYDVVVFDLSERGGQESQSVEGGVKIYRLPNDAELIVGTVKKEDRESSFHLFHSFTLQCAYHIFGIATDGNRPVISSIRGIDSNYSDHITEEVVRRSDWITSVTSDGLKRLSYIKDLNECASVIPNGIDMSSFIQWKPTRLNKGIVGTVATFRPKKNIPLLIQAYARLSVDIRKELLLVGDSYRGGDISHTRQSELNSIINTFSIVDEVNITGFIANAIVSQYHRLMRVFVLCSDHEGMPNTLLEAAASGVPIVATAVDGVKDIFVHGKHALLVEPGNVKQLAEAITSVLIDDDLAISLSKEARALAIEHSPENELSKYLEVYNRLT